MRRAVPSINLTVCLTRPRTIISRLNYTNNMTKLEETDAANINASLLQHSQEPKI
jgi:hypothetical protein